MRTSPFIRQQYLSEENLEALNFMALQLKTAQLPPNLTKKVSNLFRSLCCRWKLETLKSPDLLSVGDTKCLKLHVKNVRLPVSLLLSFQVEHASKTALLFNRLLKSKYLARTVHLLITIKKETQRREIPLALLFALIGICLLLCITGEPVGQLGLVFNCYWLVRIRHSISLSISSSIAVLPGSSVPNASIITVLLDLLSKKLHLVAVEWLHGLHIVLWNWIQVRLQKSAEHTNKQTNKHTHSRVCLPRSVLPFGHHQTAGRSSKTNPWVA